jgi:hypothetical protein
MFVCRIFNAVYTNTTVHTETQDLFGSTFLFGQRQLHQFFTADFKIEIKVLYIMSNFEWKYIVESSTE